MSETVKLIIEIPKDAYRACRPLKTDNDQGILTFCVVNAIAGGIPLDDVLNKISAEIDEKLSHYEHFSSSNTANGLMTAKKIIEKYKGDSEC